jgi:hypothetical protein
MGDKSKPYATFAVVLALVFAVPAHAATPQVVDPADDANGGVYWAGNPDTPTPAGSQSYGDVRSVRFAAVKSVRITNGRRTASVTALTVSMTLSAPPVPPDGATAVYRVLASGPGCVFGIDHYTAAPAGQAASAIQEWCVPTTRRRPIGAPVISGSTLTWRVPLSALPRNAKVSAGTILTELHFETLVLPRQAACTGDAAIPAEEQPPCGFLLDGTFRRDATFTIR